MLVQGCEEANFDASTGTCSAPFWTEPPGVFSGWTSDEFRQVAGALLGAFAIAYIIHRLIKNADTT